MARQITAPELADLRTRMPPARSELFLAILTPAVVWTARVDEAAGIDLDRLAELDYDGGSGAADWGNTLADMTIYIGSAAGEFDHGMARLRGFAAGATGIAGTMEIGETSELDVADNDFITIVNEFAPWPKHMRIADDGTVYMDYDVAYTDEHLYPDPVPIMGPPACVWLPAGGTVDVDFDAGDSWSPIVPGAGYSFVWACTGAASIVGGNTATPTITFNATGTYRADCAVTADYGAGNTATFTGHRYVFVFDSSNLPRTRFTLDDCSGDWSGGGWSYSVTMYEEAGEYDPATVTGVRDRALCVLFARDWYDGAEGSIGPIDDRENVIAVGWINGESITRNPIHGTVGFEVEGPQYWLGQMTGFPSGIEDYDGNPTDWTEFEDLTVDKGLWHFLHWRTTVTRMMDVYLTGDDRQIAVFDAPLGSLWEQITQVSQNTILAHPCCDGYGRLYVEIDSQLVPVADRTPVIDVPVVMDVTTADWREQVDIQRKTVKPVSQVDLSGVAYDDGDALAIFSLARGHVFNCYGKVVKAERLALTDQAQANSLAGLIMAHENNDYPHVDIPLAANNRMIDVCPWQYITMSIAAGDTERGIVWTTKYLVPRRVSFSFREGSILADVEAEAVTGEVESTDGDVPPIPSPPPPPPPPPGPPPPPELPLPAIPGTVIIYNRTNILYSTNFDAVPPATPNWTDVTSGIRTVGANPNYAYIASVEADSGNGAGCWAVTCKHNVINNDTDPDVGVWYNPDITGGGAWYLCLSQESMEAASRIAIAACSISDVWGQVRSILPMGSGGAMVGEAKQQAGWPAIANCSSHYILDNNGLSWHYEDMYGPDLCACGTCPDHVTTYAARQRWLTQYNWVACHQIGSTKLGGGGLLLLPGSDYSNKPRCDAEPDDWWPKFPTLNDGLGANSNYLGDRTATQYSGVYYGLTEAGPTSKAGVLWSGNQDAGGVVDTGCNENLCYVPITSGHHLYWCKGMDQATYGVAANALKRNGVVLYQSFDLFGAMAAGVNPGVIGFVRVWKRESSDGIIIVRKDKITAGMAQPNKSVVYWYSPDLGLLDKTGDLQAVLGANGWTGTGPDANPAQNWNYRLDNVGATVFTVG